MTETKSGKKDNHVLHKLLPCETRECQSPIEGGYGEGYERGVGCTILCILGKGVVKLEVLEVWEESDEVQDLSASADRLFEGEESKCWREEPEALSNSWHEV